MEENTKKVIVDASFLLPFFLPDEASDSVDEVMMQFENGEVELMSATLLPYEISNALLSAVRRDRISFSDATARMADFACLDIVLVHVDSESCLVLANNHNLSVYDASYLWLAQDQQCPLLTNDETLRVVA